MSDTIKSQTSEEPSTPRIFFFTALSGLFTKGNTPCISIAGRGYYIIPCFNIRSGRLFLCAYCMFHSITGITSSLHFGIMIFQSKRTFCPRQAVCFTLNELPIIHVDSTFPWIRTDLTKLQYMLTTNFAIETVFNDEFF